VRKARSTPQSGRDGQPKGKADPVWEVLGDDEEDEPKPCGALKGSSDFMRLKVSAKDPMFLQLDISVLQHRRKVPVLITAMSLDGAFTDEDGFDMTRASPLEDTENTMLFLQLSEDGRGVDIYKPGLDIRTSDIQSAEAVKEGLGDGWLGSLERLRCIPKENETEPILVDAQKLIRAGFYVAASTAGDAADYRIIRAKSFPSNLDLSVEYKLGDSPPLKVGFSMVLLPQAIMMPRASDDRLLFFTSEYQDLGYREAVAGEAPSHEVDRDSAMIWRYNLEALPEKQIRVYVDPSVPPRWRKWFQQGIEAWNDAFPFYYHGSVRGIVPGDKDWPKDYDISDARFSTISWDLSDDVVSMGIAKVDPRSGEIIKSDIIMSSGWVKAWLQDLDDLAPGLTHDFLPRGPSARPLGLLQQGNNVKTGIRVEKGRRRSAWSAWRDGPTLNATELEDVLGAGLKSVVMHETGHILGLRHNFKGSLGVTMECLQDKNCTAKHGLSSSVMDYIPTNIQDGDPRKVDAFNPVIGGYDKLAIAFGYMPIKDLWPPRIAPELQMILKKAEAFEVCYDDGESGEDPKCIAYDMSKDPISYFEREVERHVQAHKRLLEMSVAHGEPYRLYGEAVAAMLDRTQSIGEKLVKWLGGIEDHFNHRGSKDFSTRPIDRLQQQRALALLLRILRPFDNGLTPPEKNLRFLVEGEDVDSVRSVDISRLSHQMTGDLIRQLLKPKRLLQIYRQQLLSKKGQEVLSVDDILNELLVTILEPGLTRAAAGRRLSPQEMDLQLLLVSSLKDLYMKTSPGSKKDLELADKESDELYLNSIEELPVLREPIAAKLLYFLQLARQKTLAVLEVVPIEEAQEWHICADLNGLCHCGKGLVRLAVGADNGTIAVSSVRAVATATNCLEETFQVEPLEALAGAPPMKRWCECLAAESVANGQLRSHVQLLLREFQSVFCEAFETCESPRVRLLDVEEIENPKKHSQGKNINSGDSSSSDHKRYILMAVGTVLILIAFLGIAMFVRRR